MKKMKMAVVVLAGLMLLNLGSPVHAASKQTMGDRLEISGGVAYNSFDLTDVKDGTETPLANDIDDLKAGKGYYVNGNFWITPSFGLQLGYDFAFADATNETLNSVTHHNELSAGLIGIAGRFGQNVKLHLSVGNYTLKETVSWAGFSHTTILAGPGLLLGAQMGTPITENIALHGTADVRIGGVSLKPEGSNQPEFNPDDYTNVSGLRLGMGLTMRF